MECERRSTQEAPHVSPRPKFTRSPHELAKPYLHPCKSQLTTRPDTLHTTRRLHQCVFTSIAIYRSQNRKDDLSVNAQVQERLQFIEAKMTMMSGMRMPKCNTSSSVEHAIAPSSAFEASPWSLHETIHNKSRHQLGPPGANSRTVTTDLAAAFRTPNPNDEWNVNVAVQQRFRGRTCNRPLISFRWDTFILARVNSQPVQTPTGIRTTMRTHRPSSCNASKLQTTNTLMHPQAPCNSKDFG